MTKSKRITLEKIKAYVHKKATEVYGYDECTPPLCNWDLSAIEVYREIDRLFHELDRTTPLYETFCLGGGK